MKPNNSTLPQVVFSIKSIAHIRNSYPFSYLFTALFLFISLVSFGGEVKGNNTALSANNYYSAASPLSGSESIRTNLYLLNANNTTILADGVLTEYNDLFHDKVTLEDAYKFTNINENLGLTRYGTVLAVERRPLIIDIDTLFFKLWKTTRRDYQFEFITINLNHPGMQALLEDTYLGTSRLLELNGTTKINFSINSDAASANVSRFKITYQTNIMATPLPVAFTALKGYQLNNKIFIDWKVENEINIDKYEVERSANGKEFIKLNTMAGLGKNSSYNNYSWIDDNPISGNNFYRIKSVDRDGSKKSSQVIKITTGKTGTGSITVYPNPVKSNLINLQFTNQPTGIYQVRLINNNGQVAFSGRLPVNSANISQTLFTNKKLASGIYQLEIKSPDNTINIQKVIVQD
ncbi:MAG: T9SS type A sorting domain-containing protein [Ferruginibacter sp.]